MSHYTPLPCAEFFESTDRLSPIVRLGPIDDLESALASSWLDVSRATHRFLSLLREFDLRRGWQAYGCTDCAQWLDFKLKLSRTTALEKVRIAKALWFLPLIDAAFKTGELSYSQVRALTRVADEANEADLLAYARTSTAEQLEQCCRRKRLRWSSRHWHRCWRPCLTIPPDRRRLPGRTRLLRSSHEQGQCVVRRMGRPVEEPMRW